MNVIVELDLLSATASGITDVAMPTGLQRIHYFSIKFHFNRNNDSIKAMGTFYKNTISHRKRKNQQMTQVKMFIHNRLTQHVLGIIMPIFRRTDCIKPRVVLAWMCWLRLCAVSTSRQTTHMVLYSLFS